MLRAATYKRLHKAAMRLPDLGVVEIGAGSGASSIALAWAMKDANRTSKVVVVEKCEGGSRSRFGDYRANLDILDRNLKRFGARDAIRLYPQHLTMETKDEVLALIGAERIGGLMHDADGRIDRDFAIFWPMLIDDGLIVIDDYYGKANFKPISPKFPLGGTKNLITYRLVNQFVAWGLMEIDTIDRFTVFGHKPRGADFSRFDPTVCERIVDTVLDEHPGYREAARHPRRDV